MTGELTQATRKTLISIFILSLLLLFLISKGDLVLAFNDTYSQASVLFFRAINMLGDGLLFAIIGVPLLFIRFGTTIYFALLIIIQTILVRIFKDGISASWPRPISFFSERGIDLNIANEVNIHTVDSFPSGHATTAFTLALFFMLLVKKTKWQLAIFFVFTVAAVARVYLAQHFLIDVIAGYYCALLTYLLAQLINDWLNIQSVKGNLLTVLNIQKS